MWAVETRELRKAYGSFESLVACNLEIPAGCVFGLLGPNGAGKTTLLRTLLGFLRPTSGAGWIDGFDIVHQSVLVRQQVAYLPADARLYRSLRGYSVIELFSGLHPHGSTTKSLEIARRLELDLSRRVMFMSTGMRQKLAIAVTLGCTAPLVVLDEPTANLDPNVRSEVLELVKEIREQGRTVMLSSHIFSDIDETCDRVVIMRNGRVVARQSMDQLEQLHIVTGTFPNGLSQLEATRLTAEEFVEFSQEVPPENPHARVELHLKGSPNDWLGWLESLRMGDLQIERAGIRAIYRRFHLPASGEMESADELTGQAS
jgi:ABC-2 type transport system ATP-binding protein